MLVESVRDYSAMSSAGASLIFGEVMKKVSRGERFNLGLATGNTMITLYVVSGILPFSRSSTIATFSASSETLRSTVA